MKTKKPASIQKTPKANFNDFCSDLGIPCRPANEASAANTGRFMVKMWQVNPQVFENASKHEGEMQTALRNLPEGSAEYQLAKTMVNAMVTGYSLQMPKAILNLTLNFRNSLLRNTQQHLNAVCCDLGINEIPESRRQAKKMAAHVMNNMVHPQYRIKVLQRLPHIQAAFLALPPDTQEYRLAEMMISQLTHCGKAPRALRYTKGYRKVAASLNQALKLSLIP